MPQSGTIVYHWPVHEDMIGFLPFWVLTCFQGQVPKFIASVSYFNWILYNGLGPAVQSIDMN